MKQHLKNIERKLCWRFIAFKKLFNRKRSFLHSTGWIESLKRGRPCDAEGNEIPWMNYAVIAFLDERLNKEISLFEFGSGYSTIFYANRVKHVVSVEYDEGWYSIIKNKVPDNASIIFKAKDIDGDYCRTIKESDQLYDVVIVDGRDRVNCVKHSLEKLKDTGVIILDDAEREKYQSGIDYALNRGFRVLTLESFKPNKIDYSKSKVLYRDHNCLNI